MLKQETMPEARSHSIRLGRLSIGGGAPVRVQSMLNTDTRNVESSLIQIAELCRAGCEAIRVAVPDMDAARALSSLRQGCPVPLIADIHFDYRLALAALEAGCEGLRINPGNIGNEEKINRVVDAAKEADAVIRIGVNGGSLPKDILSKHGSPNAAAMVESALKYVSMLEKRSFYNVKISIKSSSVLESLNAYRTLARLCDYPLHLGITEAGGLLRGTVKSAVGLGILLHEGIGDTLRVSLTADPVQEVRVAWEILRALGLRQRGPEIISCPTCGRTEIDIFSLAGEVEKKLEFSAAPIKVAVMGCVVNGPGEASEADIGLAGGRNKGIIFRKGKVIRTVRGNALLLTAFMEELDKLLAEMESGN